MKKKLCPIILIVVLCISMFSGCILDEMNESAELTASINSRSSAAPVKTFAPDEDVSAKPGLVGELTVSFIDVGQGDSAFIELPNGKTMLIDAGVSDAGDKITKFIQKKGYQRIDYLIATHPHADHIGGMKKVIKNFDIGEIYMPKASTNTKTYEKLLEEISERGLKIKTAKAGVSICDGIEILAPNSTNYEDLNNYSVVLRLLNGENSFLFMGDAEILSENEILNAGFDVSADVIKVGHHGSGTSSGNEFVNAVQAKYAVFSVGDDNNYNHPHIFVVEKWKKAGAQICRTDEMGTVIFNSDGTNIEMISEK